MVMIEQRCGIRRQFPNFCVIIDPPEVHTVFFMRPVKQLKVAFHKLLVMNIEGYRFLFLFIRTHGICHGLIGILMGRDTALRMQIQKLQAALIRESERQIAARTEVTAP